MLYESYQTKGASYDNNIGADQSVHLSYPVRSKSSPLEILYIAKSTDEKKGLD